MKRIFLFFLVGLLMVSMVSAAEFDNKIEYNEATDTIKFTNRLGWEWIGGGVVAEATLDSNFCIDGRYCEAQKTITIYEEKQLIQDFKTLRIDDDSWEEQNIRSHKLEYWGDIIDYGEECELGETITDENGTFYAESICREVVKGSHRGLIEFKEGDVFQAGTYEVVTSGEIKPGRVYDWQVKINGDWTTPWATWGNISLGADAEVILDSPADNFISLIPEVQFTCSANITGGSKLVNGSLYTNESGTWEAKNTTDIGNLSTDNIIIDFRLDETTGAVVDTAENYNGTNFGAARGVTGIIDNSFDFELSDTDYVNIGQASNIINFSEGSFSIWINQESFPTSAFVFEHFLGGFNDRFYVNCDNTGGCSFALGLGITSKYATSGIGSWTNLAGTWNGTDFKFYINNVLKEAQSYTFTGFGNNNFGIGRSMSGLNNYFDGKIDEFIVWNGKELNSTEVSALYNNGNGKRPEDDTSSTKSWNRTLNDSTLWTCQFCDSDGSCGFATENRTVFIDKDEPNVTIIYPTGTITTLTEGDVIDLNYTIVDTNLDSCWYEYNGTNTSISNCSLNTTFNYSQGVNTITVYANDTSGNIGNDTSNWVLLFEIINQTYNESSFETAFNNFEIYIESIASSIVLPELIYDGISYSATLNIVNSSLFYLSSSIINNESVIGNNSFFWNITLDGNEVSTPEATQNISGINFSLCDIVNNITYLSIDFRDELTLSSINATIRSSVFNYYVEDSSAQKTYTYSTSENESNYDFCFDPGIANITTDLSISYYADGYPERTFGTNVTLSNVTTNVTLDLLDDASGLYATFKFIDSTTKIGLSDVSVEIYDGTTLVIAKTTDDSGSISEWLNPNILYEVFYTKDGYTGGSQSHRPISTESILIEMSSEALIAETSITNGLTQYFYPQLTDLEANTSYDFGYYTSEGEEEISIMSFTISDESGVEIYSAEKSGDGNMSQQAINTTQNKTFIGIYEINGTDGGYYRFIRMYYIIAVNSDQYSLDQWGLSLDTYFPADERTTLTNLVWYIVWFIFMLGGFTFGYNGSFKTQRDYTDNMVSGTRGNTTAGLFFAFIITLIFTYFNTIPMPVGVINPGFLIPDAWMEQNFMGLIILVVLVWDVVSSITKHSRRGN